jgi:hypothetical protein
MSIKKGWGKREKATDYDSSSVSKGRKKKRFVSVPKTKPWRLKYCKIHSQKRNNTFKFDIMIPFSVTKLNVP